MKYYCGNCTNPFLALDELVEVVENAREITKRTLMRNCNVEQDIKDNMKIYPNDYTFHKYKNVYFFTHSAIEYFYK